MSRQGYRYQLFQDTVRNAAALTQDRPIVNVNLLSFKPQQQEGGQEQQPSAQVLTQAQRSFLSYWVALVDMISGVGGKVILAGQVANVEGTAAPIHGWECVAFVYYPTIDAYKRVVDQDQFLQIKHLRRAAVHRSVLYTTCGLRQADGVVADLEEAVKVFERAAPPINVGSLTPPQTQNCCLDITTDGAFAAKSGYHLEGVTQLVGDAGYTPWKFFRVRGPGVEDTTPRDDRHHSVTIVLKPLPTASLRSKL